MKAFFIGKREYRRVLELQDEIFTAKIARQVEIRRGESTLPLIHDVVLLVEHSTPVYTVGRRDTAQGLPSHCSIDVVKTRRGGGVTYHGPGQLTMYPIANIQQLWKECTAPKVRSPIEWFSWVLEEAMVQTAAAYRIPTHRFKTGVWADQYSHILPRKLGAIGLQLGSWVSMHGASLNVANDLNYFDEIVMCELPGRSATSICNEMSVRGIGEAAPLVEDAAPLLLHNFTANLHRASEAAVPQLLDISADRDWYGRVLAGAGIPACGR